MNEKGGKKAIKSNKRGEKLCLEKKSRERGEKRSRNTRRDDERE